MVFPLLKKIEHRMRHIDEQIKQATLNGRRKLEQEQQPNELQKPVAYDAEGRPLYAAPMAQTADVATTTQVVHVARAAEPMPVQVSDGTRKRHEESRAQYPWLNLSEHEYVIRDVPRHSIGMWAPVVLTTIISSLVIVGLIFYPDIALSLGPSAPSYGTALLIGILLLVAFILGGYLAIWVYTNNRFFLTNESVIQEIQTSIFSRREQTVSLMNIEDASFTQRGPLQTILNYGSIRLSTEGDETTYRFDYVVNPREQIGVLNNAVESFKNGRPVDEQNDD